MDNDFSKRCEEDTPEHQLVHDARIENFPGYRLSSAWLTRCGMLLWGGQATAKPTTCLECMERR